jgi:hypothetical protein
MFVVNPKELINKENTNMRQADKKIFILFVVFTALLNKSFEAVIFALLFYV